MILLRPVYVGSWNTKSLGAKLIAAIMALLQVCQGPCGDRGVFSPCIDGWMMMDGNNFSIARDCRDGTKSYVSSSARRKTGAARLIHHNVRIKVWIPGALNKLWHWRSRHRDVPKQQERAPKMTQIRMKKSFHCEREWIWVFLPVQSFYWNKLIANFHCIIDGACVKGRIPRRSPSSSEVRINLLEEFMHPSFPQLQHDSRFHGGVHKVHRNNLRWKHKNSSEDLCIHEGLATCTMAAQRSPLKQPAATRPAPARPRPSLGRIRPWRSSIEHQRNQAWPHRPLQKHPWGYSLA